MAGTILSGAECRHNVCFVLKTRWHLLLPRKPNYKTYTKNCDKDTIELLFLLLQNEDEETTSQWRCWFRAFKEHMYPVRSCRNASENNPNDEKEFYVLVQQLRPNWDGGETKKDSADLYLTHFSFLQEVRRNIVFLPLPLYSIGFLSWPRNYGHYGQVWGCERRLIVDTAPVFTVR